MFITLLFGFPSSADFWNSILATKLYFVECQCDWQMILLLIKAFFNPVLETCCFLLYWENRNKKRTSSSPSNNPPITCSWAFTWLHTLSSGTFPSQDYHLCQHLASLHHLLKDMLQQFSPNDIIKSSHLGLCHSPYHTKVLWLFFRL